MQHFHLQLHLRALQLHLLPMLRRQLLLLALQLGCSTHNNIADCSQLALALNSQPGLAVLSVGFAMALALVLVVLVLSKMLRCPPDRAQCNRTNNYRMASFVCLYWPT